MPSNPQPIVVRFRSPTSALRIRLPQAGSDFLSFTCPALSTSCQELRLGDLDQRGEAGEEARFVASRLSA